MARPYGTCTTAIVGDTGGATNQALRESWAASGAAVELLAPPQALLSLRPGDRALGRIDVRPSLDGVAAGLLDLLALSARGVRVLNGPRALLAAHDKLATARALSRAGLPHPETVHLLPGGPLPALEPPVVVKPRFGSWGRDVFLCASRDELRAVRDEIADRSWFRRQGALAQALVPPTGYDLRVVVAGGRVVGAGERMARPGDWRTNVSLGGVRRRVVPPPAACAIALAAAAAVGGALVGIDLLPHEGSHVVIEVNGAVDFTDAYSLPGRSVHRDAGEALGVLEPALERAYR